MHRAGSRRNALKCDARENAWGAEICVSRTASAVVNNTLIALPRDA